MKNISDLQEVFECLENDEIYKLAELQDKKNINPKNAEKVMYLISLAYCGEMGIENAEVNEDQLDKLINDFNISISLWASVLKGHMVITSGRLKLTDGNSCNFKLTQEGIEYVENMTGK